MWLACGGLLGLSALAGLLGVTTPPSLRYLPLVGGAVVLGLPHGAVDYLIPARLGGRTIPESLALVGLCYLVLGGADLGLWLTAPTAAALRSSP